MRIQQQEHGNHTQVSWLVPGIVCVSCVGVLLAVANAAPLPLRSSLVIWFLVLCPGLSFVPLLGIKDRLGAYTLTVTVSVVIDTVLAGVLLYSGNWNPWWTLIGLVALCFVGIVLQLLLRVKQPYT